MCGASTGGHGGQSEARAGGGPQASQEGAPHAARHPPCTMMSAVAWMLPTLLEAKQAYSPLSSWATSRMYRPPDGVTLTRGSTGTGVRSPFVQVIRGAGWPVALHSRVTLSPTSTSVFCGWITKAGRAATTKHKFRVRVLQFGTGLVLELFCFHATLWISNLSRTNTI